MTDDMECLYNIRQNLEKALVSLYEVGKWIDKRESDYYHNCNGFEKLIHQLENLHREYEYIYLRKRETRP